MSAEKTKSKKLPRNYVQILDWLLGGKSVREIANLSFRDEKVIRRIIDSDEFQKLHRETLAELHSELKNVVAGAGRDAFRFLGDMLRDPSLSKKERERVAMYLAEKQIAFLEAGAKSQSDEDASLIPDWEMP
jgi:hypothetical protein